MLIVGVKIMLFDDVIPTELYHISRLADEIFRSQFVIFTYSRSNGIVRCYKEVQAMPITDYKRTSNNRKTAVSLGVLSAIRQSFFMTEVYYERT